MKVPFNVDAYTARLIGRENLSKLDGAVIELVKNTYDADAGICIVYYENKTNTLYICDNGSGMTKDIILTHWMTIGHSSKVEKYISEKGRIQTGAKGIGRFALDRISSQCVMLTRNSSDSYLWKVNWEDFEGRKKITETYADLEKVEITFEEFFQDIVNEDMKNLIREKFDDIDLTEKKLEGTGTVFKLTDLRDEWNEEMFNNMKKSITTLFPPNINNYFNLYFFTQDSKREDSLIDPSTLDNYDYRIIFKIINDSRINIQLHRNEFDFKDEFNEVMYNAGFTDEDKEYFRGKYIEKNFNIEKTLLVDMKKIGSFNGEFYFFKNISLKNDKERFYYKDFSDRRDLSKKYGGIKIYRDDFRVRPYGEAESSGFDWLLLSNRKANNPASIAHPTNRWRVSAEQMLGDIFISRLNVNLPDQANREGIVETKEFKNFKEILIFIIKTFEEDRQYVIRKLNDYYYNKNKEEVYRKEIEEKIKEQKKKANASKNIMIEVKKVETVIEKKDEQIRNLEDENRLLRALATTGIVTNTYIHELKSLTHALNMEIIMAKEAIEYDKNFDDALRRLVKLEGLKEQFNSWFKVTIESVRKDKRTMKLWDINIILKNLVDSWQQAIDIKGVRIKFKECENTDFRCFPYEIESIINNLITNSVSAFRSENIPNQDKKIYIELEKLPKGFIINYKDNGPGLSDLFKEKPIEILEPFTTDKRDENSNLIGTGMGMWIIDKTVKSYNGKIDLQQDTLGEKGFQVKISIGNN